MYKNNMSEDEVDRALNVTLISSGDIQHVLLKADIQNIQDLVTELDDIDSEDLIVAHEDLFKAACKHFNEHISDKGIKERPQLEIKKRQLNSDKTDKGKKSICSDIVLLFHYCCKLSQVFPRIL